MRVEYFKTENEAYEMSATILYAGLSDEARFLAFAQASLLGRLSHPNLLGLFGLAQKDSAFILLSEYARNGTLKKALRLKELNSNEQLGCLVGISAGMMYLSTQGVVHRDLRRFVCWQVCFLLVCYRTLLMFA